MEQQVLQLVLKDLQQARAARERTVLTGGTKDFAEYRHLTGVIQGLTLAEQTVSGLVQKLEKADE